MADRDDRLTGFGGAAGPGMEDSVVRQFAPPHVRQAARGTVQDQLERLLQAQLRIGTAAAQLSRVRESICGPRSVAGNVAGPRTANDLLAALSALADGYFRLAGDLEADVQEIAALF